MDRQAALTFVRAKGDPVEQARLRYLLSGERPAPALIERLFSGQREDGGWNPFWASDYSSLDATCFRLAQAEQLGVTVSEPSVKSALTFLAQRQHEDGSWEEDASIAEQTPPWATPGDMAARLYLTANCGFWLATLVDPSANVQRAADYLRQQLDGEGRLPSFPHTHWLAGALWYRLHQPEAAQVLTYLEQRLPDLPASNLAWLIATFLSASVSSQFPFIERAATRLEQMQEGDGRWASEDGPAQDVHVTLEALRVLHLCGHF